MYLNYKTEYSHGAVFAPLEKVVKKAASMADYAGIADLGNTFGHVPWEKACKKYGIKPIFGVQLPVVEDLSLNERSFPLTWMTFIAKNNRGLASLYKLVDTAHKQFYYLPRLNYEQANYAAINDMFVLGGLAPLWENCSSEIFQEINPALPNKIYNFGFRASVWTIDNYYIDIQDKISYEAFADEFKLERKTGIMHIPIKKEWPSAPLDEIDYIVSRCNAAFSSAPIVKWEGRETIESLCAGGILKRDFDLNFAGKPEYQERYNRELEVIKEKNFQDYFLVVADLVRYAKTKMLVGPARGSAAGSLVCYLLGITEVDPIKYGLYFERFIDLNRSDLPDIDIDFQDDKRHLAIKYLEKKYGKDNVAQIANIGRLKPKSALNRAAKNLHISLAEIEEIKGITINLKDTFENSEVGQAFIKKYPAMKVAAELEDHVSYIGKHAAGILVCNEAVSNYCGIDSQDNQRLAMIDKRDAETLNLLKIDALGLRTLSIMAEVCDAIEKPYEWIHKLPLDDKDAFGVFNDHRFSGIFQFEGDAVKSLAKRMPIESIEDISALSALGRPGPLGSGAAWDYVHARAEKKPIKWISEHPLMIEATKETYGVIVYQEQVMRIVREIGGFSWEDTERVRKAIAKSKKDEINKFRDKFLDGSWKKDVFTTENALDVWNAIKTFSGYAFNKSHSVSYALISYYCAYLKAYYPLEFTMACLNHAKDDNSALKILRDAVENEGIEYRYIDHNDSMQKWSVIGMKTHRVLLGGFLSIHGIGPAAANKIVKLRKKGEPLPAGIQKHLDNDISSFKYLYPAKELYGDYYTEHQKFGINNPVITIKEVKKNNGKFNFIGKLVEMNPRDKNEVRFVAQRDGAYLKGQTAYLLFKLEDDTEEIRCKIKEENYFRLGKDVVENGQVDKDWYVVCGERINDWNIIFVKNIRRITRNG